MVDHQRGVEADLFAKQAEIEQHAVTLSQRQRYMSYVLFFALPVGGVDRRPDDQMTSLLMIS